ncbi:unnamed protein product [Hanseniaspora opuntiae]
MQLIKYLFAVNVLSIASNIFACAESVAQDVSLILVKQNNKHTDLLNNPCNLDFTLPDDDELLKLIVETESELDFTSLIFSTKDHTIEHPYTLKKNDKRLLENNKDDSSSTKLNYEWSLQLSQLPKTFLYYAFEQQRNNKQDDFLVDFKKIGSINKGIFSDFKSKPIINYLFRAANVEASEEVVVFFCIFITLAAFLTIMLSVKQIAESPVKVVTLKKKCGTLSYISMFLSGVVATEYFFLQYYLDNLSIFGLLKYALCSIAFTTVTGIKMSKRLF